MSDVPFVADLNVWSTKAGQPSVMVNSRQLEVHSWPYYKSLLIDFLVFSDTAENREKLSNLGCTMNPALCKALCIKEHIKNQTHAGSPATCCLDSST